MTTLQEQLAGYDRLIGQFTVHFDFGPFVDIFPNDLETPGDELNHSDFSDWELSDIKASEIEGCPIDGIVIKKGEETAVIIVRNEMSFVASQLYQAYGDKANWVTFRGDQMLQWNDLPPHIQECWIASANRARMIFSSEVKQS